MLRYAITALLATILAVSAAPADVSVVVAPLPCGIYDQNVKPFIEKDLETQSKHRSHYTMETSTRSGKRLSVEVMNVSIRLPGERNHISVFLDGKPLAKTSHQDLPLYLEVHVDDVKYRIICIRSDAPSGEEGPLPAPSGKTR